MKFHKEGNKIIPITFVASLLVCVFLYLGLKESHYFWIFYIISVLSLALIGLTLNFFRNPLVLVDVNEKAILAPCDGKVVVIEEVYEPLYFKKELIQVSIFMSPLNVHVNRTPIGGIVRFFQYLPGKFLVAWDPKSSSENEQTFTVFENKNTGVQVGCKQIAGGLARRIKWYIQEGDSIGQGQEYGFIKYGSRMDLYFSKEAKIQVALNQNTKGGVTIIALLS